MEIKQCNHPVNEQHHINSSLSYRLTMCPDCHKYILTDYSYNRKLELKSEEGERIAGGDYEYAIELAGEQGWIPKSYGYGKRGWRRNYK